MNLKTRMPLATLGEGRLALLMGTPEVALGAVVNVRDLSSMETHRDLFVRDALVYRIMDLPEELLDAMGYTHFSACRVDISDRHRVGIPAEAQVTIVVLGDPDVEIFPEPDDETPLMEMDDMEDDILPLVLPMIDMPDMELDEDVELELEVDEDLE